MKRQAAWMLLLLASAAAGDDGAEEQAVITKTVKQTLEALPVLTHLRLVDVAFDRPSCAPNGLWVVRFGPYDGDFCQVDEATLACSVGRIPECPTSSTAPNEPRMCPICRIVVDSLHQTLEPSLTSLQVEWPDSRLAEDVVVSGQTGAVRFAYDISNVDLVSERPLGDGDWGSGIQGVQEGGFEAFDPDPGWFRVWRTTQDGQGNNGVGSETFVGMWYEQDPGGMYEPRSSFHRVAEIPLGESSWWRTVTDTGFYSGSTHSVLCADPIPGGLKVYEACSTNPDPRALPPSHEDRCQAVLSGCAAPYQRPSPDTRSGIYARRGGTYEKLRARKVVPLFDATDSLRATEWAAQWGYYVWIEGRNVGPNAVQLGGAILGHADSTSPFDREAQPACLIDAGARFILQIGRYFDDGRDWPDVPSDMAVCQLSAAWDDATGEAVFFIDDGEAPGRPFLAADLPKDVDPVAPFTPNDGFAETLQRDEHGRWCFAPATPGQPNVSCPK